MTQHAGGEARLGTARANDVYKRFADPSFTPELRLMVMKTGVLQSTSCWRVDPESTMDEIWDAAFSCLLPFRFWRLQASRFDHGRLNDDARGILAQTAMQAFLGTTIFKIDAVRKDNHGGLRFEVPALFKGVGVHVHYLDMVIRVNVDIYDPFRDPSETWAAIQDLQWLKSHFPNLKSCVLTLEMDYGETRLRDSMFTIGSRVRWSDQNSAPKCKRCWDRDNVLQGQRSISSQALK